MNRLARLALAAAIILATAACGPGSGGSVAPGGSAAPASAPASAPAASDDGY